MTTTQSLAIEPKAITISQYEALVSDVEIAKQQAVESFNYEDSKGDKAARSYIAGLRKIRARIEAARKEAKAYALEYGRAVDGQAKELEAQILGLIEPHQQALDAITQREKDRVAAHEEKLRLISAMVQSASIPDQPAATIREAITWLQVCPTGDMEEFEQRANSEIDTGLRILEALHTAAVEREKREALEAAEAQRLAAEQEARQKAEEEARQAEAVERGRQEAADAAARAVAEAEARAKESEDRAALAEAERVRQQEEMEAAIKEQARELEEREQQAREAKEAMREELVNELSTRMTGLNRKQAASLIVDGTLHPAITIDWGKVS
jgi:chemosensory pili system protein ChpA (sensor histidine kinase/response regulator)